MNDCLGNYCHGNYIIALTMIVKAEVVWERIDAKTDRALPWKQHQKAIRNGYGLEANKHAANGDGLPKSACLCGCQHDRAEIS